MGLSSTGKVLRFHYTCPLLLQRCVGRSCVREGWEMVVFDDSSTIKIDRVRQREREIELYKERPCKRERE